MKREDRGVFVDLSDGSSGQLVIRPQLLDEARDMLRRGGWLADERGLSHIEVVPLKLGGQPSLRGRRWSVDHVARIAVDEEGWRILMEDYRLGPNEVRDAVAWSDAAAALG